MVNSPQYERLEIETDQPVAPQGRRSQLLTWAAGGLTLLLLITILAFSAGPRHQSGTLEVKADDSPADKRGAGLLLT